MVERPADHAGDRGDGLEHDGAVAISFPKEQIDEEAQKFAKSEREALRRACGLVMPFKIKTIDGCHTWLPGTALDLA
jgi:hypothetical protein